MRRALRSPPAQLFGSIFFMPALFKNGNSRHEGLSYVLCRRTGDRAENPTAVGVGVVHHALVVPHAPQRGFFVTEATARVTDGCEVADVRSLHPQIDFHKPIRSDSLSPPSWRLVTLRTLRSLCYNTHSWREVKAVRFRLRLSVCLQRAVTHYM